MVDQGRFSPVSSSLSAWHKLLLAGSRLMFVQLSLALHLFLATIPTATLTSTSAETPPMMQGRRSCSCGSGMGETCILALRGLSRLPQVVGSMEQEQVLSRMTTLTASWKWKHLFLQASTLLQSLSFSQKTLPSTPNSCSHFDPSFSSTYTSCQRVLPPSRTSLKRRLPMVLSVMVKLLVPRQSRFCLPRKLSTTVGRSWLSAVASGRLTTRQWVWQRCSLVGRVISASVTGSPGSRASQRAGSCCSRMKMGVLPRRLATSNSVLRWLITPSWLLWPNVPTPPFETSNSYPLPASNFCASAIRPSPSTRMTSGRQRESLQLLEASTLDWVWESARMSSLGVLGKQDRQSSAREREGLERRAWLWGSVARAWWRAAGSGRTQSPFQVLSSWATSAERAGERPMERKNSEWSCPKQVRISLSSWAAARRARTSKIAIFIVDRQLNELMEAHFHLNKQTTLPPTTLPRCPHLPISIPQLLQLLCG